MTCPDCHTELVAELTEALATMRGRVEELEKDRTKLYRIVWGIANWDEGKYEKERDTVAGMKHAANTYLVAEAKNVRVTTALATSTSLKEGE